MKYRSGLPLQGRRQWHPTPLLLPGNSHGWRSLVGCSPLGHEESSMTERLHFHFSLSCLGEGNGNPFQCSCLENPRDGGAWWDAICGVTQCRTQLKRLSSSIMKYRVSWVAQTMKNLPAVLETQVWSLSQEDSLEKETAIHSSILAKRITWTEEADGLQSMWSQRVKHWATNTYEIYINVSFLLLVQRDSR